MCPDTIRSTLGGTGQCAASREQSRCGPFYACQDVKKVGSTALKLMGQRPYGELGICGFVVELGVSRDEP